MARRKQPRLDVSSEFAGIDLGDVRRNVRARRVAAALQEDPSRSFPKAVDTIAEREALYRLLENDDVSFAAMLGGHVEETQKRSAQLRARPLVIVDKTEFSFHGEADRDGLERHSGSRQGFQAFFGLAVSSEDRMPLGVLAIRPVEGRGATSSTGWEAAIAESTAPLAALNPIVLADREADGYELFSSLIAQRQDFVIRVGSRRKGRADHDSESETLGELAARSPVLLEREVVLSKRRTTGRPPSAERKHPARDSRLARLEVRACPVILSKRDSSPKGLPQRIGVHTVLVTELDPPANEEPVEWRLVTSLPIQSASQVAFVIDAYRARWTIEEYFKALMSGCAYEKRQLESKHALLNALALLAPLAWRLLALKTLARDNHTAASAVLSDDELRVLRLISKDIEVGARPTAADVLNALARLGGHFPQNGRPGWGVIWTGMMKLQGRVEGYLLAKAEM